MNNSEIKNLETLRGNVEAASAKDAVRIAAAGGFFRRSKKAAVEAVSDAIKRARVRALRSSPAGRGY